MKEIMSSSLRLRSFAEQRPSPGTAAHRSAGNVGSVAADNGIEVEGLVREYRKGPRAVDGIDISVAPGEIYGFLGPNGAGKSTTVHVLTTLLPPTAETVASAATTSRTPKACGSSGRAGRAPTRFTGRDHCAPGHAARSQDQRITRRDFPPRRPG
jgi:ABC-type glutathione transport system ATPase component